MFLCFYSISLTKQKHYKLLVCTRENETTSFLCISIPFPDCVFLLNVFAMKTTHERNMYIFTFVYNIYNKPTTKSGISH